MVTTSRRAQRHEATRADLVAAAWELSREHGLAGLNMRDLAARVGLRAPSLYSYFPSKDAIYDAMFRQGWEDFIAWMTPAESHADPVVHMRGAAHRFFTFCTNDPVRYQLLFLRTLPGFTPSDDSYAVAIRALDLMTEDFASLGVTDPGAADLVTAVLTGLTSQQLANDPGGDRWERLVDRAVHMLLVETAPHLLPAAATRRRTPSQKGTT